MKSPFKTKVRKFLSCEKGATLVEYGIAIVLAVTIGTGALILLANNVNANLNQASTEMATR